LIANIDLYRQIRADALKANGTVDADFALRTKNASANARALGGNLQHLAIIAGDKLIPPLIDLSARALAITEKIVVWTDKHPKLTSMIVQGVAALAIFNLGLGALRIGFGNIIGPITTAYNAFKWMKEVGVIGRGVAMAAPLIEGALGGIGLAATAFGEAMGVAGAFLLANPIVLVITAIVVALAFAVPWIIKHWDAIKAGAMAFGASLAESFAPIMPVVHGVVNFLGGVWNKIKGPLMVGMNWLKGLDWKGLGAFFISSMIGGIFGMLGPLGGVFKKAALAGYNAFQKADRPLPKGMSMAAGIAAATVASTSPSIAATPAAVRGAHAPVVVQHGPTTINVHAAPGQSPHDVAAEVSRQLDKRDRDARSRGKSSLRDDEE
jgi:hypothetical protein